MEQLEFFSIPSPCVGVCSLDEKGYCHGCMRKREERFNWLSMTSAEKLHVIKLCRQRYRRKLRTHELDSASSQRSMEKSPESPQKSLFD